MRNMSKHFEAFNLSINAVASEIIWAFLATILSAIVSVILESKYHITNRIRKKKHTLLNSDAGLKLHFALNSPAEFSEFKSLFKDEFREDYGFLDISRDNSQTLKCNLGEEFKVTVNNGEKITIFTERIDSTVRKIDGDVEKFTETLSRVVEKSENTEITEYTAELFLPYVDNYVKTYLPEQFEKESLELEVRHKEYRSKVSLQSKSLSIHSEKLRHLERILDAFL